MGEEILTEYLLNIMTQTVNSSLLFLYIFVQLEN